MDIRVLFSRGDVGEDGDVLVAQDHANEILSQIIE